MHTLESMFISLRNYQAGLAAMKLKERLVRFVLLIPVCMCV